MESLKSYNSVTPSLFQLNSYPAAFQSAKRENKSQILQDLSGSMLGVNKLFLYSWKAYGKSCVFTKHRSPQLSVSEFHILEATV